MLTDAHVADESLYQIAWKQPGPWPALDTVGRLGAYRYLSYMVTSNVLGSDAATDDIRSQYPSSNNTEIATNGQPTQVPFQAGGTWTDIAPGIGRQGYGLYLYPGGYDRRRQPAGP